MDYMDTRYTMSSFFVPAKRVVGVRQRRYGVCLHRRRAGAGS